MKITKILFILLFCTQAYSQTDLIKPIEDKKLNDFIGSVVKFDIHKFNDSTITTIISSNSSGSAKTGFDGEVTHNLFITKCENGEAVICKTFIFKDKYNIVVDKVEEANETYKIHVMYGDSEHRKSEILIIKN